MKIKFFKSLFLSLLLSLSLTQSCVTRLYDRQVGDIIDADKDDAEFDNTNTALNTHTADTSAHDATGGVVGVSKVQTLTNKSLTSPVITNSPTASGATWASIGTISAGTATLTLISPTITTSPTAAGATWTNLGTVTTADINGGTIDGSIIGGSSAAAGTFTSIAGTGLTLTSTATTTNPFSLSAANLTTGFAISSTNLDALTSGGFLTFKSNSADTSTRALIVGHNDNSAATGTVVFKGTQDSTDPVFEGDVGTPSSDYRAVFKARFTGNTNKAGYQIFSDTGADVRGFLMADNSTGVYLGMKGGSIFFNNDTTTIANFNSTGELLLPDDDTPTANYGNRNSFVKGWALIDSDGTILGSYNVTNVTHIATGVYVINWDTNFSSANYAVLATPFAGLDAVNQYSINVTINDGGQATVNVIKDVENTNSTSEIIETELKFSVMAIGTQ